MQFSNSNKIKKIVLILVWYSLLLFIFGELLTRYLFIPQKPEIDYVLNDGFYTYPISDEFTYINEDKIKIKVITDKYGLRNSNLELINNVILLGDSSIGAVNTENNKTLASNLNAYNAGVDGFSSFQSIRLLYKLLEDSNPETVILGFFLGNDFRDNYQDQSNGLFKKKNSLNENYQNNISIKGRLVNIVKKSHLITSFYRFFKKLNSSPSMESYAVSEIYSYLDIPNEEFNNAKKYTEKAFEQLSILSEEYGFKVIIVGIPSKAQVYKSFKEINHYENDAHARLIALSAINKGFSFDTPDKLISKLSSKYSFEYVSLLDHFRINSSKKLYYYIDDH